MAIKKILAATDFSPRSRHAVERAAHLAHQFGAELRLVHVVPDLLRFDRHPDRPQSIQAGIVRGAERSLEVMGHDVQKKYSVSPSWTVIYGRASLAILERLSRLTLPPTAPPAFLLDDRRRYGNTVAPAPGIFDNRSVSLPTDFPSASRLLAHGIRRVVLVQERSTHPQEDLSHTLVRWQEAGVEVLAVNLSTPGPARSIAVQKPTMYRRIWQRVLATMGLRRNPLGGFGGLLPVPSTG